MMNELPKVIDDWLNADFRARVLNGEKDKLPAKRTELRETTLAFAQKALIDRFGDNAVSNALSGSTKSSPGYDFLVAGKVRVKASVCRWKEILDFNIGPAKNNKGLESSDVWLVVDLAGFIDGQIGKYIDEEEFRRTNQVAYWLAPSSELLELANSGKFGKARIRLQLVRPGSQIRASSYAPLLSYRENWGVFDQFSNNESVEMPTHEKASSISELIRLRRMELGLTQTELAERLGLSNSNFISVIEAGSSRLPRAKVHPMAKALAMPPKELAMKWIEEHEPEIAEMLELGGVN